MPRYYFHLTDGKHACSDADGLDLPDDEAALTEAKLEAWDLRNDPGDRCDWAEWIIQVFDEKGRSVISLPIEPRWRMSGFASALERLLTGFRRPVGPRIMD